LPVDCYPEDVSRFVSIDIFWGVLVGSSLTRMSSTSYHCDSSRLNDLTANLPNGMNNPARKDNPAINTKRKQTLLSLLDALHELSQDDEVRAYGGLFFFCVAVLFDFHTLATQAQATSQASKMIGMSVSNTRCFQGDKIVLMYNFSHRRRTSPSRRCRNLQKVPKVVM